MGKENKNDVKHDASKEISDDSIKLLIREEVERRLDSPTASLVKFIEDEVRARIRRQEWYYWGILVVIAVLSSFAFVAFWKTELKEIPAEVNKQLASAGFEESQRELTNYVANARISDLRINNLLIATKVLADDVNTNIENLLVVTKSNAETINSNLSQIPSSISTNVYVPFANRLEQLKNQDNILLADDLPKLFVRELVANLVDESSMVLSYEPIASTVKIYSYQNPGNNSFQRFYLLENIGYCQGRTIYLTNKPPAFVSQVVSHVQNGGVYIEYIRKSLH